MVTLALLGWPGAAGAQDAAGGAPRAADAPASGVPGVAAPAGPAIEAEPAPSETTRDAGAAPDDEPEAVRARTREEELFLLDIRQARLELDRARTAMDEARDERQNVQKLFDEKLVTIERLNAAAQAHEDARTRYRTAQLALQRRRLEFLKNATLVTLADATKYRDPKTRAVCARVTLRNASDLRKARIAMTALAQPADDGSAESLEPTSDAALKRLLEVDPVEVTIRARTAVGTGEGQGPAATENVIVGDPVERRTRLAYGQEAEVTFGLRKPDVEAVTVVLTFAGTTKEYDVFLKPEGQQQLPDVTSTIYMQKGRLGRSIRYDLELERLAKDEAAFSLFVLNLPEAIPVEFLDPASEASVAQVKFTEERTKQGLYLELSLPERLDPALVGSEISFYVLVSRPTTVKQIAALQRRYADEPVPPEALKGLKASWLELRVIPQGTGKLELVVPNLYQEVTQGAPVEIKFRVLNAGTLELRRITPELEAPLDWTVELTPTSADVLAGGEKALFTALLQPPEDVEVGQYTVKMLAEGQSGIEPVEAEDKDFTVEVKAESSLTGTAILVGVLVLLVVGIAIASVKISRR